MTKAYIGEWGSDLMPGAYGRALAALGVLVHTDFADAGLGSLADPAGLAALLQREWDTHRERLFWGSYDKTSWDRAIDMISPGSAAAAWESFCSRLPEPQRLPRLQIISQYMDDDTAAATYPWLNQVLMHPGASVRSLFFEWWLNTRAAQHQAKERTAWHWPLRIGFLPDSASRQLKEDIESAWFYSTTLVQFRILTAGTEACDLLLSPLDMGGTRVGIERARARTSAMLLLPQRLVATAESFLELISLRNIASASAIGVVGTEKPVEYLLTVLDEVAHDAPLDASLCVAARGLSEEPPLVIATRGFIERSRISTIPEGLAGRLAGNNMVAEAYELIDATRELVFDSEKHGASSMLDQAKQYTEKLSTPTPRFIQARTKRWDFERDDLQEIAGFARGGWHAVSVHIGPLAPGERSPLFPFPEHRIHWSSERERLTVVLTAPGCTIRALGDTIYDDLDQPHPAFLRRFGFPPDMIEEASPPDRRGEAALTEISIGAGGPSTQGIFLLRPGEGEHVVARIMILHSNRVLQTALLEGPILDGEDALSPPREGSMSDIALRREGVIRMSLDDLDDRQSFDAAFVVNEMLDKALVTAVAGAEVKLRSFGEGKQAAESIRDILIEVLDYPDDFSESGSEALRDLLIRLAQQGKPLYDSLVHDFGLGKVLRDTTLRVQLVSADPEAYLPLEFLYEGDAPYFDAQLCPNRGPALQLGGCANCPNRQSSAFVCPVRFWGLNKIIERHAFSGKDAPEADLIRLNWPVPADRRFPPPSVGLLAHSGKAELFPGGHDANVEVLKSLAATVTTALTTALWPDWLKLVHQHGPTLFVLLPHTERTRYGAVLEIGDKSQLSAAQINQQVVGEAEKIIVILLGCDTADPSIAYTSFPTRFRLAGAKIVIGTLTPILGRHAAPVARALIDDLRGIWGLRGEDATLGEVMAGLRRRFMERGLPVGLALIAYGDADWVLGTG
jgi:hypothetical protein